MNNWRDEAACREVDPELFFPVSTTGPGRLQIEQAKAVCGRCPVVGRCLAWALTHGITDGVWGGLDEDQLRAARHTTEARAA